KQPLPQAHEVSAPRQQSPAPDVRSPSNSQDSATGNTPGISDSPTSAHPSPLQTSSVPDMVNGIWNVVHSSQEGSKHLESKDARFGPECHDGAIRATIAAKANDWAHIELRCDKEGSRYSFILKPTGKAVIGYLKPRVKGEVVLQVDYDKNIRQSDHTIEFRAVGRKLTGLVNGVEMLSVEDDRISSGCFGIESKFLDSYREVAFLNLDQSNPSQIITAAPVSSAPSTDSRLPKIETEFQEAFDRDIVRAREAAVADLDAKYVAALGRADAAAINAGKSDESLRLKEEIQRVQNKQPTPSNEVEPVPASLKQLRATYDGALAKIEHEWDAKSRTSYDELDRQLDGLQKSLIEENRPDEASLVKTKRDQIADKITRP
ncbi:MAG: hypothetical protein K8R87_03705, partial [Verrucomicrobia bacterium]|nr:hypothetical protein [Verrucomicrobiota bacterium]